MTVSSGVCEPAGSVPHTLPHLRLHGDQVPLPLVTAIPQTTSRKVDTGAQGGGGWYQQREATATRDIIPVVYPRVRTKYEAWQNGVVQSDIVGLH